MSDRFQRALFSLACVTVILAAGTSLLRPHSAVASPSVSPRCEIFQAGGLVTESAMESKMSDMLGDGRTQFIAFTSGANPVFCAW